MPPEIIAHIYSFLQLECNCCMRPIQHPNDVRIMYKFQNHHREPIVYYYCSEECVMFLN